jgi:hypothetical protein
MRPTMPLFAAFLGLLLAPSLSVATDNQATDQESQAILLKIEQQLSLGHFIAPSDDNAVSTWQEFLRRAALGTPGTTRALAEFAERMRDQANEQVLKKNLDIAADLQAFEDLANRLQVQIQTNVVAHQPARDVASSATVVPPMNIAPKTAPSLNENISLKTVPPPNENVSPKATPSPNENVSLKTTPSHNDNAAAAAFLSRGDALLSIKDISGARKFYEYAANLGNAAAAMAMGRTFDPDYLNGLGVAGLKPDPERAVGWYRKASALGNHEAQLRLQTISASR